MNDRRSFGQLIEEVEHLARTLVAAVSHDLRGPLSSIKASSSILADPQLNAALDPVAQHQLAVLIDTQSDRLAALVTNVLDMSRVQGGVLKPRASVTSVSDLVATVVADFRKALPTAEIFVYDNNSSDRTIAVARAAGAEVRSERRQGKGHVVRRMFADVDADVYVLVDGDATYDAASAPRMIDTLLSDHLDMVVGFRVDQVQAAYRPGHRTGNWMLTSFLSSIFCPATGCFRGASSNRFPCFPTVSRSKPN